MNATILSFGNWTPDPMRHLCEVCLSVNLSRERNMWPHTPVSYVFLLQQVSQSSGVSNGNYYPPTVLEDVEPVIRWLEEPSLFSSLSGRILFYCYVVVVGSPWHSLPYRGNTLSFHSQAFLLCDVECPSWEEQKLVALGMTLLRCHIILIKYVRRLYIQIK